MEHFMAIIDDLFNISGKRVVITGGTGGIGAGLVSGFLAAGTKVVVSARSAESAVQARATHSGNPNVQFIEADLASDGSIQQFISKANESLGGIDVLIQAHGNCEKLMPFLHLPVQSGSDRVLKLMNRKHTVSFYEDIIHRLRDVNPDIGFSSDFIVGFPGETDKDYKKNYMLDHKIPALQGLLFPQSLYPFHQETLQ